MDEQQHLIQVIESFCSQSGIAESTFGRHAVNDGKFVGRLREGKGVTTATVAKVHRYLLDHGNTQNVRNAPTLAQPNLSPTLRENEPVHKADRSEFRFYDNRQKYLLFVNTCSESYFASTHISPSIRGIASSRSSIIH